MELETYENDKATGHLLGVFKIAKSYRKGAKSEGGSKRGRAEGGGEAMRREISQRLGVQADAVDVRAAASLRDRITPGPDVLDALAAPLGVLMRERKVA